jgi:hypothetical protein
LAIGPIAAKKLAEGLTALVTEYEKKFGPMPADPSTPPMQLQQYGTPPENSPAPAPRKSRKSNKGERA